VLGILLLISVGNADAAPNERFTAKMLDAQVDEMNLMHLPVRLANGTTIAKVKRLGRTLIFDITGNAQSNWAIVQAELKSGAFQRKACADPQQRQMLKMDVSFAWSYIDTKGDMLGAAVLKPADCGF
jgi:hypothetical protein